MDSGAHQRKRAATATSAFGVSRRENHDASDFYARFVPPILGDVVVVASDELADSNGEKNNR